MIPGTLDLTIYRGDTYGRRLTITVDGTPLDLTGATILAQVRQSSEADDVLVAFTVTVVGAPTAGTLELSLNDVETAAMTRGGRWDLQVTTTERHTYVAGTVTLVRDVSRDA